MSILSELTTQLHAVATAFNGKFPKDYWLPEEEYVEFYKELRATSKVPYYHFEIDCGLTGIGYWETDLEGHCQPNIYFNGVVIRSLR